MSTVFGLIIQKKLPAKIVFENERILAIEDIHPEAPVHILIMPKKEISNLQAMEPHDYPLLGEIVRVAQEIAEERGIGDNYRFLTNNGAGAGQTIFHLHFHLIGGRVLGKMA
ncbi:MAG: histidine triad nucleotide-binding protein [Chlamydiales bacterium]